MIEATNIYSNLSDQTKFRLIEINKIRYYFNAKISEINIMSKYIAVFDYLDKPLIALSATTGGISVISFASIIRAPEGIASASFSLIFSLTTRIVKKLLKITRNKQKKHNKIIMKTISKLNNIETLISQALIEILKSVMKNVKQSLI